MPTTIRARLMLLMMTVLLPAIAAALFVVARVYQGERDELQRGLRDSARAMAQVVDRELARRIDLAHALATSHLLTREPDDELDLAFLHDWSSLLARDLGGWIELHSASHRLMDTRQPAGSPAVAHRPGEFKLSREPVVLPLDFRGPGDWSPPRVVQPVTGPRGTLLNLVITVPPEVLQRAVDHQRLPETWVGTVMDSQRVLARHPGGAAYVGRPGTFDMMKRLGQAREGPFNSVTLDGVPVAGYFSQTSHGWSYLIAVPSDKLVGEVPVAVLQVVGGALLLLAIAAAAAMWVGRGIAQAAESLKAAARNLRAGAHVRPQASTDIVEFDEVGSTLAVASQALSSAHEEMQRQVADAVTRTRQAEKQVAEGQRIAALGRLTGGVAHDFNNLLGVISNCAHLIANHAERNPALQMPVDATLRAVEMGSHLSRQLLRFGGRQPVSPRPVDLAAQLPEMGELLQMMVRKNIRVSVDVRPGTQPVKIDTSELELALINLALNARDALPGGGRLWLQARNAEADDVVGLPPGRYVLVTMTDDGAGMDEAHAAQVFEPFFTTKAMGQGAGLGLSQVHGFCVQAGGTARMASTPGLGSTVSMILPACGPEPLVNVQDAGTPPQADVAALAGVNLLLVEDSDELAEVTALLLRSYGCEVRRARNVDDALAQIASDDALQLVLSDVVMPGPRNGVDLARELSLLRPALPVVLISGYSAALDGLTGYAILRKPVAADLLASTLAAALRGGGSAGSAGGH